MDVGNFGLGQLSWAMNVRYIFAAGMASALWDHILTFVDEIEYFWFPKSWTIESVLFVGSRYTTILGSLFVGIMTSGSISLTERVLITVEAISVPLGICASHALVAVRVFGLWDHRTHAMKILWSIFAVTYGCFCILLALMLKFILANVSLQPGVGLCQVPHKTGLGPGAWASLLTFNILVISLIASSAVERPYRRNKDVIDRLKRDGCLSLLVLTVTCILNLVMQLAGNSQTSYTFFVTAWAIDNSVLSRLFLRIEAEKRQPARPGLIEFHPLSDINHLSARNSLGRGLRHIPL